MNGQKGRPFRHNTDLGQNFLVDFSVLQFILETSAPGPEETILEIGAGQGVLTRPLALSGCRHLYSLEIDRRLEGDLADLEKTFSNLKVFWGDAVTFDYAKDLPQSPHKVIANIPYHITTPLIWKLLEDLAPKGLRYLLLMVQKEAADRLTAPAGTKMRYPLGVTLELMGHVRRLRRVPPGAFRPAPRVDSALIEIEIDRRQSLACDHSWRRLLKAAFGQRRKTLANNLGASFGLPRESLLAIFSDIGVDGKIRAEELDGDQWLRLARELVSPASASDTTH